MTDSITGLWYPHHKPRYRIVWARNLFAGGGDIDPREFLGYYICRVYDEGNPVLFRAPFFNFVTNKLEIPS